MSIPYPVNSATKQSGSVASITTDPITTVSGDLLVAIITAFGNTIGATPIIDSNSNAWSNAIGPIGTTNGFVSILYVANCVGGAAHTFTFTPTSSNEIAISVIEIAAAALSSVLGSTASSSANSSTHTTGSITAGSTPEIFIGGGAISHGTELTPVLNKSENWFTVAALADGTPEGIISAFRIVAAGVSDTFSYTCSAGFNEGIVIAAFKGTASTGGERSATFFGA